MDNLSFQSALAIANRIHSGQISALAVTEYFLQRINTAVGLDAFSVVLADEARAAARQADAILATQGPLSALHGVPIAIKESIDIAGVQSTAGSLSRAQMVASEDSAVVTKLRAAGMVIVGKNRMTEFAFGLSGQNPTCGTPWNPWCHHEHRAPGGSSSGAGVAVAAGLVPIALGGDTGGSVRAPAAFNHVVGYKTSNHLIDGRGCVPLAPSLDVLGPIARNVDDAFALSYILAVDGQTMLQGQLHEKDKTTYVLDKQFFPCPLDDKTEQVWDDVIRQLLVDGWKIKKWSPVGWHGIHQWSVLNSDIIAYESHDLFGQLAADPNSQLWEVVQQRIQNGANFDEATRVEIMAQKEDAMTFFAKEMGKVGTILMPVSPFGARAMDVADSHHSGVGAFCRAVNFINAPAISLPVGFDSEKMPIAVQLFAAHGQDQLLLERAKHMGALVCDDTIHPDLSPWGLS